MSCKHVTIIIPDAVTWSLSNIFPVSKQTNLIYIFVESFDDDIDAKEFVQAKIESLVANNEAKHGPELEGSSYNLFIYNNPQLVYPFHFSFYSFISSFTCLF